MFPGSCNCICTALVRTEQIDTVFICTLPYSRSLFCHFAVILFQVESEQSQTSGVESSRGAECVVTAALPVRDA